MLYQAAWGKLRNKVQMNPEAKCRMFCTSLETEKWPPLKGCLEMSHLSWERMLEGSSCALEENSQNRGACDSFHVTCTLWASLHPRHSDSTQLSLCCWGHAGRLRGGLRLSWEGCVRSHSPLTPQLEGTVAGLFFFPPSKAKKSVFTGRWREWQVEFTFLVRHKQWYAGVN